MDERDDIFTVYARRCRRCGGLLTSEQALKDGYGHVCKLKTERTEAMRQLLRDQISLFEEAET